MNPRYHPSRKMNKSPGLFRLASRCWPSGHAAGKRAKRPLLHGIFFPVFSNRRKCHGITRRPCPRVRPRGHTTQRARGEIFKLLLRQTPADNRHLATVLRLPRRGHHRRRGVGRARARGSVDEEPCWDRGQPEDDTQAMTRILTSKFKN